jgi:RNA polymerase sigma-70 factor (ECF subfamily)
VAAGEPTDAQTHARDAADRIYRSESRRVLATLIRLLGDFDLAEEALHDAFVAAVERWPVEGIPRNPVAWLVSAGRFRAIDHLRRRATHDAALARTVGEALTQAPPEPDDEEIPDDRLRLIFTCCHPALAPEARVALTLRTVGGLTTEEIARAFLVPAPTLAQRIVRAKGKIRDARIPYEVPSRAELPDRTDTVLSVLYLIFNEGYSASFGEAVTRGDLCAETIRLARLLLELLPDPEVEGLLALMLLHDARRAARSGPAGELVLLEEQDRTRWDRERIDEGCARVTSALGAGTPGPYALQAAIAAVHAEARDARETDWRQIVGLYDLLLRSQPTPVVELNRAVAVAMRDGPAAGLSLVDGILARGSLDAYHLAHAARADLLRRLGRVDDAAAAYRRAFELATQEPERRFLADRLRAVQRAKGEPGTSPASAT